ncbi:MAG: hypothetical protein WDW38_007966 [Sanguina aurantia]
MGQTALHIASLWGNLESMRVLLDLGLSACVENSRGTTPLHFAACAKKDALAACKLLLERGAQTDTMDFSNRVPFECADTNDVRSLLGGPDGRLFAACTEGDAAQLSALLASGEIPSLRVVDHEGHSPLNLAVASGSLETVQVLLAHDLVTARMPDATGDSALHVAAEMCNLPIVKALLAVATAAEMDINMQNVAQSEYAQGNWSLHGEALQPHDKTALHLAVAAGDVEVATALLDAGADVNLLDFDKASPLHLALEMLDMPMLELLLSGGADVNQPNKDFTCALHLAATKGPTPLLQLLLSHGADTSVTNTDGWSALHIAARAGNVPKTTMLLAAGLSPTASNAQGNTPLHLAAANSRTAVAELLLESEADPRIQNKDGKQAVDLAKTDQMRSCLQR